MRPDPRLALLIGMLAVSSAAILFRFTTAPPFVVATYRLGLAALLMVLLTGDRMAELKKLSRNEAALLLSGLSLAFHFSLWFYSLRHTTIAASTIIVTSSPIILIASSWALLGEKPVPKGILGTALSFLGILIIFWGHDMGRLWGDLLAFLAMLAVVVYLMAGRVLRKKLDTLPYVSSVYSLSFIFLLTFSILNGDPLAGYPVNEYFVFALLALIPSGIGHTAYNYSLKYFKTYLVSLTVLGEPIIATLLAIPIFGELPNLTTVLGGIMIGAGMYAALRGEKVQIVA